MSKLYGKNHWSWKVPLTGIFQINEKTWGRNCPTCGIEIQYTTVRASWVSKLNATKAETKQTLCNECKGKGRVRSEHERLKIKYGVIRQRLDGKMSVDEYLATKPEKELYYNEVWRITNSQPLSTLENYELRGRSGIKGAYQLDHIISIYEGFIKKINPNIIGGIDNLRMIPWIENRNKSYK